MIKQTNLTTVMIVQQLDEEYWIGWQDTEPIKLAKEGDCHPLLEAVVKRLNNGGITVGEAYGIVHDKDEIRVWDSEKMQNVIELKAKHVHFLLKFEKGASLQKLALTVGLESQYLEKLKSGRYGYDNCQAYLVHAKDETKYQYSPDEVVSVLGEDYTNLYNRKMETWVKGRETKKAKETNLSVDFLVSEIIQGKVTKSNILLSNEYYTIYAQHKRRVNEALETAGEKKSYQTIADLENGKFKKTVLFLTAGSGVGKTLLSKQLIKIIQTVALKNGDSSWDFCLTASNNAFDEYNGQDILLLDDIRGDSLSVSDWLKLLDPYTISPISARYHNKMGSAKVIIITSTKTPLHFFKMAKGNIGEDLGQFFRRIDYLVNLDKNFTLSVPTRNPNPAPLQKNAWHSPNSYSFIFAKSKILSKNKAIDKLIKTVINNMQWNIKKEHIS